MSVPQRRPRQHQLRLKQRQQYELSRKNIELINQKCHRLKMQLTDLRRECGKTLDDALLQELENSVMVYDSVVRTGNEVLDTVLTEKSLRCDQKNITWTCMADGQCLRFMDTVDLYILFGSLLDRAIAQVEKLTTAEKRVVAVTVSAQNGTAYNLRITANCMHRSLWRKKYRLSQPSMKAHRPVMYRMESA